MLLLPSFAARAGSPAARQGDPGDPAFHAGSRVAGGSTNVLINGIPAARAGDPTTCPQVCPGVFPIPHSNGSITSSSSTVLINGLGAARVGSAIHEPGTPAGCQPVHSVTVGSNDVSIGP
ncbi:MAG TPA: hypothetical protein ENI85_07300 [Deltaproteobacteria bacterium]|nr:hypothetical protein [Deltaproteobacteria bacterium]